MIRDRIPGVFRFPGFVIVALGGGKRRRKSGIWNGLRHSDFAVSAIKTGKKSSKKSAKKFGGKEKSSTFAIPFGK